MNFFATILSMFGAAVANTGSKECLAIMIDEPECPKSLIK